MAPVSILVLVDEALEETSRTGNYRWDKVSILVLVDEALEESGSILSRTNDRVSILVLVDEALEVSRIQCGSLTLYRFNPCSRG